MLLHTLLVAVGLIPLAWLAWDVARDNLSANPIEDITHRTGDWTLRLLLVTLAVTPLRRLTGRGELIRFRRTIGLLAFSYACLHFLTYAILDQGLFLQGLVIDYVVEDVIKRPYITVGFTAFLLLIPLAVTSTKGWVRRLGGQRWNALHRVIYIAGALGVLHYLWLVKGDQLAPVWYAGILVVLLGARVVAGRRSSRRAAESPSTEPPNPPPPPPARAPAAHPTPTPAAAPPPP